MSHSESWHTPLSCGVFTTSVLLFEFSAQKLCSRSLTLTPEQLNPQHRLRHCPYFNQGENKEKPDLWHSVCVLKSCCRTSRKGPMETGLSPAGDPPAVPRSPTSSASSAGRLGRAGGTTVPECWNWPRVLSCRLHAGVRQGITSVEPSTGQLDLGVKDIAGAFRGTCALTHMLWKPSTDLDKLSLLSI